MRLTQRPPDSSPTVRSPSTADRRRATWAAALLGFAAGGFFDGIVLHQILQWHHLLSGLETDRAGDLRLQVLADGLFHAAMYAIAAVGMAWLVRARDALAGPGSGHRFVAVMLLGFASWHLVDAVLSHWVLGLHRIRMDVADPFAWDLGWLLATGLPAVLLAALLLRRARARHAGIGRGGTTTLPVTVAAVVGGAAVLASLPPDRGADQASSLSTVVLRPGVDPGQFLAAVDADLRIVWGSADGAVWVLDAGGAGTPWRLYRHGAVYVGGSLLPAGCSAWLRT